MCSPARSPPPVDDHEEEDILTFLPAAVSFISAALESPDAGVLVHCLAGVSRSATVVAAWLLAQRVVANVPEAVALMRSARRWANPNPGFLKQLEAYAASVPAAAPAEECELCKLEPRTPWLDDADPRFVIVECDQCQLPMAVLRQHTMSVPPEVAAAMEASLRRVASGLFAGAPFFIDRKQRQIADHCHWHARPAPPWVSAGVSTPLLASSTSRL